MNNEAVRTLEEQKEWVELQELVAHKNEEVEAVAEFLYSVDITAEELASRRNKQMETTYKSLVEQFENDGMPTKDAELEASTDLWETFFDWKERMYFSHVYGTLRYRELQHKADNPDYSPVVDLSDELATRRAAKTASDNEW